MSIVWTLMWSEWRRQRKLFLILLFSTVILWMFMWGMVQFKLFLQEIEMTAVALVIGLPFLYCIALGGSFASEFTDKSESFLLGLPVSKTKIYFSKYLSNLLIFLIISIAGSLLMYSLTSLTPGKKFFDDLGAFTRPVAIIALLITWILSHATVFLYNLISRNTGSGIIALLTLPIIFVIISFGTSPITMFFFAEDKSWIISYAVLSSIIIYWWMIIFGWYLWKKRISCDLDTLKPITLAVIILLFVPALPYSFNYLYTKYQYESALLEARQSGLELEVKREPQPAKIPDALNGMTDIMQFCEYKNKLLKVKNHKKIKNLLQICYKFSWTDLKNMTLKKQCEAAKHILHDPDMGKLYLIIEEALKKTQIQYIVKYDKRNIIKNWSHYYKHMDAVRYAIGFLLGRAYAQHCLGDDKAFFKSIKQAEQLFEFIKQMRLEYAFIDRRVITRIYAVIIQGPEGIEYTDNYTNALNAIKKDKIYPPSYITNIAGNFKYNKEIFYRYSLNPFYRFGRAICRSSRCRQSLSYWIRNRIEYNKLYLSAQKTNCLKNIIETYCFLDKKKPYKFGSLEVGAPWSLLYYFLARSKMAGDKLCLALKIYRCRYGKYPEKLQELCPEILKEIPLEPRTETPYTYRKEGKGFLLYGEKDKVLGRNIGNSEYYSKTYYMKYQPWNPQGKEKTK